MRAISDPRFVDLLTDPVPPGATDGRWWPPQMLDAAWLTRNAERFDVLHLHFGAESYSTEHVEAAVAKITDGGHPLVYTVHDLENPQLADQAEHRRMLDAVIPAATALITLTPGAAREIRSRWGRDAAVIAHPSLLPMDESAVPTGTRRATTVAGMHLRDLRPNIDGIGAVGTLARALVIAREQGEELHGIVYLNEHVRDESTARAVEAMADATPNLTLRRRPRASDAQLWSEIAELDVCVLPYRHGTHSGWIELCHDLGVPVAGPRVGYLGEQHPESYEYFTIGDPPSLASAIGRAARVAGSLPGSDARMHTIAERRRARRAAVGEIRDAHTTLYAHLTKDGS